MGAVTFSQIDVIDRLLGIVDCNLNLENVIGETALFYAVRVGNLQIIDKLIVYGSDIYHVTMNNNNLLHYSVKDYYQLELI